MTALIILLDARAEMLLPLTPVLAQVRRSGAGREVCAGADLRQNIADGPQMMERPSLQFFRVDVTEGTVNSRKLPT